MTEEKSQTLLTPEVKALIGQQSEVVEMYGEIDKESVRRYVHAIPDQDPRHWDEELAEPRFGATTTPPLMITYIAGRKPPGEEDRTDEVMHDNWYYDGGSGMKRREQGLTPIRDVAPTKGVLHLGEFVEICRFPKLGDKIRYQTKYKDIQEKMSSKGWPFLLITRETRYWNQDDETICVVQTLLGER